MTSDELEGYRKKLERLRLRITGNAAHLADEAMRSPETTAIPLGAAFSQPGDEGTEGEEQEFTLNLLANQEQALDDIDAALNRLHRGQFGQCEECDGHIHRARLRTLPYTRYCVACARKLQKNI